MTTRSYKSILLGVAALTTLACDQAADTAIGYREAGSTTTYLWDYARTKSENGASVSQSLVFGDSLMTRVAGDITWLTNAYSDSNKVYFARGSDVPYAITAQCDGAAQSERYTLPGGNHFVLEYRCSEANPGSGAAPGCICSDLSIISCATCDATCLDSAAPDTKALEPHYEGEDQVPTGICQTRSYPVTYLTEDERKQYEIKVKDGLLVDINDNVFQTSPGDETIFVMSPSGSLYMKNSPLTDVCRFHHSSFLAGTPVSAAGTIEVNAGVIEEITNESGHYRPTGQLVDQALSELAARGVDTQGIIKQYQ